MKSEDAAKAPKAPKAPYAAPTLQKQQLIEEVLGQSITSYFT